jgi:excisionase family DNA binding protein
MAPFKSPREFAALLGISEAAVRRQVRQGKLKHVRFGRQIRIADEEVQRVMAPLGRAGVAPKPSSTHDSARSPTQDPPRKLPTLATDEAATAIMAVLQRHEDRIHELRTKTQALIDLVIASCGWSEEEYETRAQEAIKQALETIGRNIPNVSGEIRDTMARLKNRPATD